MGRQNTVRQVSRQSSRQSRQHTTQQRTASQQRAASDQNSANQRRKILPLKPISSSQDELKRLLFAARLIQRHPWLLWIVALAILVGSATAAITTLLNPDASIPASTPYSPGIAVGSSPPVSSPIETNRLERLPALTPTPPASSINSAHHSGADSGSLPQPLRQKSNQPNQPSPSTASPRSAIEAIALSCAAGCFVLSQWLKPKPARRRVLFESQPSSEQIQHSTGQVQAANLSAEAVTTPIASPELLQLPAAHSISFDLNPAGSQSHETPLAETAEVAVLPAEQSHPLDWEEPSLADSLDLRQRCPLSYWL